MDHTDLPTPGRGRDGAAPDPLRDFRALVSELREAEDAAASALSVRQQAATYADEIVRHAETLAHQIEADARARAEHIVAEAEARAARSVADAEAEVAQSRQQTDDARVALLAAIAQAQADLRPPGPPAADAATGVDVLFGTVEAARPVSPPPSSPRRRPAWP